jgi:Family of unknown function (DUF5652)
MQWQNGYGPLGLSLGWGAGIGFFIAILIVWTLFWKGIALWKAAREGSMAWFVALLIVNTVGILEIIYIFGFSKHPGISSLKS